MTNNNVVPLTNKRDWKWHRDRIATAWGKQVSSIIETGQCLKDAKLELEHGSFEAMIKLKLPFGESAGHKLMKIAGNPILSKVDHGPLLPPSWRTLYELNLLPPEILLVKLKDGSIHPKLERKDVLAMRPTRKTKPKSATRDQLINAKQRDPTANQRDAAEQLGVSLGVYQRIRNELIGSGEIKGAFTLDDLRERMVALLHSASKEERMRECKLFMKALNLDLHDWVSTMTIGKRGK